MATIRSFLNTFLSLLLLLSHLGCFIFNTNDRPPLKKRKISPNSPSNPSQSSIKTPKSLSSIWSNLKQIIHFKNNKKENETHLKTQSSPEPIVSVVLPDTIPTTPLRYEPETSLNHPCFPCSTCGEIFPKTQLLEQHQSIKHAITELYEGDSGKNIVEIIFKTGWKEKEKRNPVIHRILKIHNSPKILAKFEEYREYVKSKASRNAVKKRDERCIADGNELLRFHCSTFICNLGKIGNSGVCNQQYCSVCGIIRSGFSAKMDGISTMSSSWRAHVAFPEEIEEEFAFMNLKRVMLVCRVIAGRIGCDQDVVEKEDGGFESFDSVVVRGGGAHVRFDEDELNVFNPRAVLPCFVIIYSV